MLEKNRKASEKETKRRYSADRDKVEKNNVICYLDERQSKKRRQKTSTNNNRNW